MDAKKGTSYEVPFNLLAGAEGLEPPVPGPKPGALPLGDAPTKIFLITNYYSSDSALSVGETPCSSRSFTFIYSATIVSSIILRVPEFKG